MFLVAAPVAREPAGSYAHLFTSDGTNFFVMGTSDSSGSSSAAIERLSPQGAAPVTVANLAPSNHNFGGLAADDACIYFTTASGIYSLSSSAEGVSVQ